MYLPLIFDPDALDDRLAATLPDLPRRLLVRIGMGLAASSAIGTFFGCTYDSGTTEAAPLRPDPALGRCIEPVSDTERTLYALADTIVPGADTDPTGAPGAPEACVMNVFFDPALPFMQWGSTVRLLFDGEASKRFGADHFYDLKYEQREEIAAHFSQGNPILILLYRLIRATFYTDVYNEIGTQWMGYPGENLGYIDDPNFTFGIPVSKEAGKNGSLA